MASSTIDTAGEPQQLSITADEIALYDRQIRLWGVQAQENIRRAKVLLIGIKGLGNEIAKNLVLAGIQSLAVADHQIVTHEDLGAQFFITEEDVGKNVGWITKSNVADIQSEPQLLSRTFNV
jgi:ubiquitin-like 1-activating enzyme E1 A